MAKKVSSNRTTLLLMAVLLILSFGLRFFRIEQVPSALYFDEVDLGYQARSLIETHKDYRGRQTPFYVLSFNDPRVPIPAYAIALTTLLPLSEELQVRLPNVIIGSLVVLLVFLLIKLWTNNLLISFVVALTFATNPWQLQFSRWAHEGIFTEFFFLSSLYLFYLALKKQRFKYLFFSTILAALMFYTYRTMSLFTPLYILSLVVLYFREIKQFGLKKLIIIIAIFCVIDIPFLLSTTYLAPDIPRIVQVSIFSDKLAPILIQRDREVDSNDYQTHIIGKKASPESFVFHNKLISYAETFLKNYLETFSTSFLFLTGDPNPRQGIGRLAELLYVDLIGLVAGLYFVGRNLKLKIYQFLVLLLLLSPIPSSITEGGASHGSRLFIFSVPLLIIIGLGWVNIIKNVLKLRFSKLILALLGIVWIFNFVYYLHLYQVHYPIESAQYFGYGFKQAAQDISKEINNYKKVYITKGNDPPMIYLLFWSHIPPKALQDYGTEFNVDKDLGKPLDKYKVIDLHIDKDQVNDLAKYIEPNILYVVTRKELPVIMRKKEDAPPGINLIDIVKYPDNEPAFYILAKE